MAHVAVVRNPRAKAAPPVADIERALAATHIAADIHDVPARAEAQWLDRLADTYDVLAASGGDGTVSSVAAAVIRFNKTLAVIPSGTLNHFARDAGIPVDLNQAVAVLARHRIGYVDVGVVNDQIFINNASIGGYPQMVQERVRLERLGRRRRFASIAAVARTWWQLRSLTARLSVDGTEIIRRSPFIVVGNGSYVVSGLDLGARHDLADGRLTLYVTPGRGRLGVLALPVRALFGTLEAEEQFEVFRAFTIAVDVSPPRLRVAIDGEVIVLPTPLRFSIRSNALRVLMPLPEDLR